MDPLIFRGMERLLVVFGGIFLTFLGYRLFIHLPEKSDAQGKVILPGGISVYMSRIGPGAFLALFGAIILGWSTYVQLQRDGPGGDTNGTAVGGYRYAWMGQDAGDSQEGAPFDDVAARLRGTIRGLNELHKALIANENSEEKKSEYDTRLIMLKLPLMEAVWEKDWGSYEVFTAWAATRKDERGALPESMLEPQTIFTEGL